MTDFDVNRYRSSIHEKLDKAYEAFDIVCNSNIGSNARPVVFDCIQECISMLNRKLYNSFTYGGNGDVSSSDACTL